MGKGLLFAREVKTKCGLPVKVPTVEEVYDSHDRYAALVTMLTATPWSMRVWLDDMKEDFMRYTDFTLFGLFWDRLKESDLSLIFGESDALASFEMAVNEDSGETAFVSKEKQIIIDEAAHREIADILRGINGIERESKTVKDPMVKKYVINRERLRQERARERAKDKPLRLESEITALVCSGEFPYDFETVRRMTIYQFHAGMKQVARRVGFDNLMIGYYNGTIKADKLSKDQLSWIPL